MFRDYVAIANTYAQWVVDGDLPAKSEAPKEKKLRDGLPSIVRGRILDNITGEPVRDAEVVLSGANRFHHALRTDEKGCYEIGALEKLKRCTLEASCLGYKPSKTKLVLGKSKSISFNIHLVPVGTCKWVRIACRNHLDELKKQHDSDHPCYLDEERASRPAAFTEGLPHTKGRWAKGSYEDRLIELSPFQCFLIVCGFGWIRKDDHTRRYKKFFWMMPRKNGKSLLAAALGLYMLLEDDEPGAEIYSGATSKKQAYEVFRPARLMAIQAEKHDAFAEHYGLDIGAMNLCVQEDGSKFEPVIGKPGDGPSPHMGIVDEYHEHPDADLFNTFETGMGSRDNPILLIITTAGSNTASPCFDLFVEAKKVLQGIIKNDELFSMLYTIDEDDEWDDFNNWIKANPNYGISIRETFLQARFRDACQLAEKQNVNKTKHLNVWVNADNAWLNVLEWKACQRDIKLDDYHGCQCWIGIDLATRDDIAAMVILFKDDKDKYAIFGKYYIPEDTIEQPENKHYQTWDIEGDIIIATDGATIDFDQIEDDLKELRSIFEIQEVAYDPFQATQFSNHMTAEGFKMIEIGATVKNFSEPMKELGKLIKDQDIAHDGNPAMTWMMSNVVAHMDKKENIFPNKERPANKIDGPVATIMALNRAMMGEVRGSVYDRRDVRTAG